MSKPVYVTYYVHSTSTYNEQHKLAGWRDVPLSKLGKKQSIQLRALTKSKKFDAVFSSDLKRAYETANTVFGKRYKVRKDKRLRECNYGRLGGTDSSIADGENGTQWINKRFPSGESYKDVAKRINSFIRFLKTNYAGKHIAIVAHQAPQLSFEVYCNKKTWNNAIRTDWRNSVRVNGSLRGWRLGWKYTIT